MCSVRGPKSIVDIDISKCGELLAQCGFIGFLGIGASKTFKAVATEPIDLWRSRPVNT